MPSLLEYPKRPSGTHAHLAPANATELADDIRAAKRVLNAARLTLRNAHVMAAHNQQVDDATMAQYRQDVHLAVVEYNEAVTQWHAAWRPWREAEKVRRQQVRDQLRANQRATERAQLRAATCATCGTIHAGEC